ncbi:solute carrier organic anion transporter family member 3A1-like [Saccoglossus kowalevskii]|uniref:Solute carrier organic anion transporter family member 5A1-like n=1 Tax=Saccoglossus kowalevskii TaxID=10224 RepID=A0ABM0GJA9_SACKO|nr:PREDICTED: solute carrier organic anion transporter family member 5A1-like [Saccoglossus kowalevskii]
MSLSSSDGSYGRRYYDYSRDSQSSPSISSLSSSCLSDDHVTNNYRQNEIVSPTSSSTGNHGPVNDGSQGGEGNSLSYSPETPDKTRINGSSTYPSSNYRNPPSSRPYSSNDSLQSDDRNSDPSPYDARHPSSDEALHAPSRSSVSSRSESTPRIDGSQHSLRSREADRRSRTSSRAESNNVLQDIMEGMGSLPPGSQSHGSVSDDIPRLEPEGRHSSSHDSLTHKNDSEQSLTRAGGPGSGTSLCDTEEKQQQEHHIETADKIEEENKHNISLSTAGDVKVSGKAKEKKKKKKNVKSQTVVHVEDGTDLHDIGNDHKCALCCCTCGCLQGLANSKYFLFLICALLLLQTYLVGFMASMLTTIERRFDLYTTEVGILASMYEVGSLAAIVLVSYCGGKSRTHRPKWIAGGALLIVVGCAVTVLPHFISEPYDPYGSLIRYDNTITIYEANYRENICNTTAKAPVFDRCDADVPMLFGKKDMNLYYYIMMVFGQVLVGMGSTPVMTLGVAYIDDNVSKRAAPLYISIFDSMFGLGPIIGFIAGWLLGSLYVDFYNSETTLTVDDPRWVGAWWIGIIIGGGLVIFASLPFWVFPKKLWVEWNPVSTVTAIREDAVIQAPDGDRADNDEGNTNSEVLLRSRKLPRKVKDMPGTTKRLLTNCTYMCISIGACCEIAFAAGYYLFLPKYLQSQYGVSASFADLVIACVPAPSFVIGVIVIGVIIYRTNLGRRGMLTVLVCLSFFSTVLMGLQILLGCNPPQFAGANTNYYSVSEVGEVSLSAYCNKDCGCTDRAYNPVCGSNGITYYSPCHAGCTKKDGQIYYECGCVEASEMTPPTVMMTTTPTTTKISKDNASDQVDNNAANLTTKAPIALQQYQIVTSMVVELPVKEYPNSINAGVCKQDCDYFIPFMIMLCLSTVLLSMETIPVVMVTLRSVVQRDKAFAIGVQYLILRLFGFVPAPIYYGKAIDFTCILWHTRPCGEQGACWVYDIEMYKYLFFGMSVVLKGLAFIFFIIALISMCVCKPRTELVYAEEETALTQTKCSREAAKKEKEKKKKKKERKSKALAEDIEDPDDVSKRETLKAEDLEKKSKEKKKKKGKKQKDLDRVAACDDQGSHGDRSEDRFLMADNQQVEAEETRLAEVVVRHGSNESVEEEDTPVGGPSPDGIPVADGDDDYDIDDIAD